MHQLHHPKIVQLLGVCTAPRSPFYIVTELMPNGGIAVLEERREERKENNVWRNCLTCCSRSLTNGLLEEKKFIHRDLRAANILVGHENVVKVGDFGLSRLIEEDVYDAVPIRWTAPEAATDKVFTNKSDVWSFGVLIYEVVTRGRVPYQEHQNKAILKLVSEGHRMLNPRTMSSRAFDAT
uniref:Non-specific protein-tyrosine kinase n=1 Tax=Macrostomum lignano TaxID=282301 RepID=A0A1I8JRH4_9PLAT